MAQLYGTCACERNQYTIIIPSDVRTHAQVFFDNSRDSRRTQASPVTAWLRIPLDWYHSTTYALFPDETPTSIRKTYHTPARAATPVRRQFCGYCGTHLTAWSEGNEADREAANRLDITLGSLLGESVEQLEALKIIPNADDDEDDDEADENGDYGGLVKGGTVDDDVHIPTTERPAPVRSRGGDDDEMVKGGTIHDDVHIPTTEGTAMHGMEGPGATTTAAPVATTSRATARSLQRMRNRGLPYFEEMVENSRLGRIKRQKGGALSADGRTTVEWEIVEIGNGDSAGGEGDDAGASGGRGVKRPQPES